MSTRHVFGQRQAVDFVPSLRVPKQPLYHFRQRLSQGVSRLPAQQAPSFGDIDRVVLIGQIDYLLGRFGSAEG
jgi:hypothetical protein